MFAAIKAQHGGVDVCINNAGLAHPEPLLHGKTSGWKNMFDVRGLDSCNRGGWEIIKAQSNIQRLLASALFIFVPRSAGKRSCVVCMYT